MEHLAASCSPRLSDEQVEFIERFVSMYNKIDRCLRKMTGKQKAETFSSVLTEYSGKRKTWMKQEDILRTVGDLRNCIIHSKTEPYMYCAIPTPIILEEMEKILRQLEKPTTVIPKFQREVDKVRVSDSIADVLKRINKHKYSQFPVYDDRGFKGLLTENGITRWLACHVANELSMVETAEVTVKEVLKEEEKRKNCAFVEKGKTVEDAKECFSENTFLEALLITETGKQTESLLGIATRWDMLNL